MGDGVGGCGKAGLCKAGVGRARRLPLCATLRLAALRHLRHPPCCSPRHAAARPAPAGCQGRPLRLRPRSEVRRRAGPERLPADLAQGESLMIPSSPNTRGRGGVEQRGGRGKSRGCRGGLCKRAGSHALPTTSTFSPPAWRRACPCPPSPGGVCGAGAPACPSCLPPQPVAPAPLSVCRALPSLSPRSWLRARSGTPAWAPLTRSSCWVSGGGGGGGRGPPPPPPPPAGGGGRGGGGGRAPRARAR